MMKKKIFSDAYKLLSYLESDNPDQYVFRGQTREYDGPMLPSGLRDRFHEFDGSVESQWAGVTTQSAILREEFLAEVGETATVKGNTLEDGNSSWILGETDFQRGFAEYFNQTQKVATHKTSHLLRESVIPSMSRLLGNDIAEILCQQYGFTSLALDVSTDPEVAIFFATHAYPFYSKQSSSPYLGVVYRWPRDSALIAEELFLSCENTEIRNVGNWFKREIDTMPYLEVKHLKILWQTPDEEISKRLLIISTENDANLEIPIRVPKGSYANSRMGRQGAAMLRPLSREIIPLRPRSIEDRANLIADLQNACWGQNKSVKHHAETFYFRHGACELPERLNKFELWPGIIADGKELLSNTTLQIKTATFEDPFLELMLRFFSSCSPLSIALLPLGIVQGVVDPGYQIEAKDASFFAAQIKTNKLDLPFPALRYFSEYKVGPFKKAFNETIKN